MGPPEIAILGFGFGLGIAVGAALVTTIRGRFLDRREVRITVAPNSVTPRRAATLAFAEPAPDDGAGPTTFGDERWPVATGTTAGIPVSPAATLAQTRTRVPSARVELPATAVAVPIGDGPGATQAASPAPVVAAVRAGAAPAAPVPVVAPAAVPIGRTRPTTTMRPVPIEARALAAEAWAVESATSITPAPVAIRAASPAIEAPGRPVPVSIPRPAPSPAPSPVRPAAPAPTPSLAASSCRAERLLVDERCSAAAAARDRASDAADRQRAVRDAYEITVEQAARAREAADPDAVTAAKDALHRDFRAARDAATTTADMEAAARDWLDGVNRVNGAARDARAILETSDREMRELLPRLERVAAEADVAVRAADAEEASCRMARELLAACEERQSGIAATASAAGIVSARAAVAPAIGEMTVVRILRGETAAREQLAARLAVDDVAGVGAWRVRVEALIEAVMARAVADGYLDLPDDGFWRPFTRAERRDVVVALSALGFAFDGLGGFAGGRVPFQRDLGLAVGYAGLDRMRIRSWPDGAELQGLYAGAVVAGDEWLADHATDLSLGRMIDALGAYADDLAEIWNAWSRVRPALIASD